MRAQHPDNQLAIEQAAAVKPLVALLSKGSASVQEEAAGALMNLTLKQPSVQAEVAKGGAIPLLVEMLAEKEGQMEEVAGALTNLADTNEDNQVEIGKAGAIAPLVKLCGASTPQSCQEEAVRNTNDRTPSPFPLLLPLTYSLSLTLSPILRRSPTLMLHSHSDDVSLDALSL